eukprot:6176751-Pleurochrysis_carterae.AAC.1
MADKTFILAAAIENSAKGVDNIVYIAQHVTVSFYDTFTNLFLSHAVGPTPNYVVALLCESASTLWSHGKNAFYLLQVALRQIEAQAW